MAVYGNDEVVTGEVISVKRLTNSQMGNPSWSVLVCAPESNGFPAQRLRTMANAMVSYEIGEHMVGKVYGITLTPSGRIRRMREVV